MKEETVEKTEKKREKNEIKEEKRKPCNECVAYDWTSEREFHRDGIREGLVEIRGVCKNPKAPAYRHLVHATLTRRQCSYWEKGKYKPPRKETKKESEEEKTAPSEHHGPPLTEVEKKELEKKKTSKKYRQS